MTIEELVSDLEELEDRLLEKVKSPDHACGALTLEEDDIYRQGRDHGVYALIRAVLGYLKGTRRELEGLDLF